jgi:hypothetical protein
MIILSSNYELLDKMQKQQIQKKEHIEVQEQSIKEKYQTVLAQLLKLNTDADDSGTRNEEDSHVLQDDIYRMFIIDIVKGKFKDFEEISVVAILMKQFVVDYDFGRWYS